MKPGYTEFSFGYAFTENLIRANAHNVAGAPVFPNLIQEATLGYDIRIDFPAVPLFFQFKLPELMVRRSAREISIHSIPGLSVPFFRMPMMRRDQSQQHSYLVDLEISHPGTVFYASPALADLSRFNAAYLAGRVHQETAFFSPLDIGLLTDNEQHSVAYSSHLAGGWFCSKPQEIRRIRFSGIIENTQKMFGKKDFQSLETVARETTKAVVHAIKHRRSRDVREGFVVTEDADGLPSRIVASDLSRAIDTAAAPTYDFEPEESVSVDALADKVRGLVRERVISRREGEKPDERTEAVIEEILVAHDLARVGLGMEILFAQPQE